MSNHQQLDLFNFEREPKVINKPIRLIELFAGLGAQHKALTLLARYFPQIKFESWKICEWAIPSIKAYNLLHIRDFTDYGENKTIEEMIQRINGVSSNYNEPIPLKTLQKMRFSQIKDIYNDVIATKNLVNIMSVHAKDLEIVDTDKYEYILTYSFPCQDLSLAGNRKGMSVSQADGGTRSGLLWEVERILNELYIESREREESTLPQILLMENVPEVIGTNNVKDFVKWTNKLESLGYVNYWHILNSKDYGVPQNRRRCFMVSILNGYGYTFPIKLNLKWKLKDFLEKGKVDRKYYLTEEHIERISNWKAQQKPLENLDKTISPTLTARGAGEEHSGMVLVQTELFKDGEVVDYDSSDEFRREHSTDETPCLLTKPKLAVVEKNDGGGIPILEANKDGYKVAYDGDGVNIASRMAKQRGNVQKGLSQTLKTEIEVAVVEYEKEQD